MTGPSESHPSRRTLFGLLVAILGGQRAAGAAGATAPVAPALPAHGDLTVEQLDAEFVRLLRLILFGPRDEAWDRVAAGLTRDRIVERLQQDASARSPAAGSAPAPGGLPAPGRGAP